MKVQIVVDERYPTYYVDEMDGSYPPWGLGVDWPADWSYEDWREVLRDFDIWQSRFETLYKEQRKIADNAPP